MNTEHFATKFNEFADGRDDAVQTLRRRAIDRFRALGFPTRREEEWAYTDVSPIANLTLPLGRPTTNLLASADAQSLGLGRGLVFVDGHFRADLSHVPSGVTFLSLKDALEQNPDLVGARLAKFADAETQPFTALNTAFLEDGAFLHVPKGTRIEEPLYVLYVGTEKSVYPRNLFMIDDGAEATLVEQYVSHGEAAHFTNSVTETIVGANASFVHHRLQTENDHALHVTATHIHQDRDSRLTNSVATVGGRLVRNNLRAALDGEGIVTTLNGVSLTRDAQHVDNHTWLEHRKPHCDSHELYKGILGDQSSSVFSGYIHVFPDAQKTDAKQSSSNLLLSNEAVADSKPQLEIYADDVKCTHGATIGQLDEDALFYLRARGVRAPEARKLLVRAFASEVTNQIEIEPVREHINNLIAERLPDEID